LKIGYTDIEKNSTRTKLLRLEF